MTYYFSKQLEMPFDQAVEHVTEALAAKGFGILTTIDVRATMKKKLNVNSAPTPYSAPAILSSHTRRCRART